MKRFLLSLLLLAGLIPAVWAQSRYSVLQLQLDDQSPIAVSIDGRYYQQKARHLTIDRLPPGRHYLRVYALRLSRSGRERRVLVYEGRVRTLAGAISICEVHTRRGVMRVRTRPLEAHTRQEHDRPVRFQDEQMEEPDIPEAAAGLRAPELQDLKQQVQERITDAEKIKLIQQSVSGKSLNTADVGTMMDWLVFESSRLELAQWAFRYVSDPGRYESLTDAFTFQENRDAFTRLLRERP